MPQKSWHLKNQRLPLCGAWERRWRPPKCSYAILTYYSRYDRNVCWCVCVWLDATTWFLIPLSASCRTLCVLQIQTTTTNLECWTHRITNCHIDTSRLHTCTYVAGALPRGFTSRYPIALPHCEPKVLNFHTTQKEFSHRNILRLNAPFQTEYLPGDVRLVNWDWWCAAHLQNELEVDGLFENRAARSVRGYIVV